MRRAGGWILGFCIVAAMAGGSWIALWPLWTRETVEIGYFRAVNGRGPSNDAMLSGATFALAEAGYRAGRFRVQLVEVHSLDGPVPLVWIGTSDALEEHDDFQPARFKISSLETQLGNLQLHDPILSARYRQGMEAGKWTFDSGAKRPLLLIDRTNPRGEKIAYGFQTMLPNVALDHVDPLEKRLERIELVNHILLANPDLIFYSGEEAPYGTSELLFKELRARGYAGTLLMGEADPEVSFLGVPCRVPEGTLLISPIGPPSAAFAAAYETATGRHAGPHGWIGYLAAKRALAVIGKSEHATADDFELTAMQLGRVDLPCALYVARDGKFAFLQDLK